MLPIWEGIEQQLLFKEGFIGQGLQKMSLYGARSVRFVPVQSQVLVEVEMPLSNLKSTDQCL